MQGSILVLLSRELEGVYRSLEKGRGTLARWRLAREATNLHTVLLEVTELTERADNAIKFLGDMFSARLYRLAATKVGGWTIRILSPRSCAPRKGCTASWLTSSTRGAPLCSS